MGTMAKKMRKQRKLPKEVAQSTGPESLKSVMEVKMKSVKRDVQEVLARGMRGQVLETKKQLAHWRKKHAAHKREVAELKKSIKKLHWVIAKRDKEIKGIREGVYVQKDNVECDDE